MMNFVAVTPREMSDEIGRMGRDREYIRNFY